MAFDRQLQLAEDEYILAQLLSGNHLEPKEEARAKQLVHGFSIRLGMVV